MPPESRGVPAVQHHWCAIIKDTAQRAGTMAGRLYIESGTPGAVRHAAPTLGQHTDEVLVQAGVSPERIAELRRNGVIE